MLVMLMVVTVVMNDYVRAELSSESDFYERLFKKTFYQDSLKKYRNQSTVIDVEKYRTQIMKKQMTVHKEPPENITQKITTQQTMTQKTVTQGNIKQKTKKESKPNHKWTPDGKKCPEFEDDFTDREYHNIQLVDEMFVNTDNEITGIQAHEVEDAYFPSVADSQNGPAQNTEVEETVFSR